MVLTIPLMASLAFRLRLLVMHRIRHDDQLQGDVALLESRVKGRTNQARPASWNQVIGTYDVMIDCHHGVMQASDGEQGLTPRRELMDDQANLPIDPVP